MFWYLLFELLGSSIVENMVFKGAWIFFAFYTDFYAILGPQNDPQIMQNENPFLEPFLTNPPA